MTCKKYVNVTRLIFSTENVYISNYVTLDLPNVSQKVRHGVNKVRRFPVFADFLTIAAAWIRLPLRFLDAEHPQLTRREE